MLELTGGPHIALPDHVVQAAADALHEHGSRASRGLPQLCAAIAARVESQLGHAIDPTREVVVTSGAMHALNIVFRTVFDQGDRVVVPAPTFFFDGPLSLAGADPVYVPSFAEAGWAWDVAAIANAVDETTKALLLCNPTNPTGFLPTPHDIAALLELAEERDLIVISDESYDRFVYDGAAFTSAGSFRSDRVIVINSLSKSYSLPTWRVGYVVAKPALIEAFVKTLEWDILHCAYVAQRVATAALEGPQDWIAAAIDEYEGRRNAVLGAVQGSSWLSAVRPQAAAFLFLDVTSFDAPSAPAEEQLLAEGIPTVRGDRFQGPGYVRLPFGGEAATIEELVERLRAFAPSHS